MTDQTPREALELLDTIDTEIWKACNKQLHPDYANDVTERIVRHIWDRSMSDDAIETFMNARIEASLGDIMEHPLPFEEAVEQMFQRERRATISGLSAFLTAVIGPRPGEES